MGLKAFGLSLLLPYLPAERVLSLGYPDLVMTQDELHKVAGIRTLAERDFGQWHGMQQPNPETVEAFSRLGTKEFRCVDIVASRGVEQIVDLNEADVTIPHYYDLVLDCGTTEHCADFWNATANAAEAARDGGVVFHTPPLTMLNHGFVCVQPTFYYDLYTQNGWTIEQLIVSDGERYFDAPRTGRFKTEPEMSLYCIARRHGCERLKYPRQSKYLNHPMLGAKAAA